MNHEISFENWLKSTFKTDILSSISQIYKNNYKYF
jgi:hypothetical protein